jgi:hypothetical protein
LRSPGWSKCNLGDAMLAGEALDEIRIRFEREYLENNRPNDMALLVRHESEGRLHCEVVVYFPPATAMIAKAFEAIACRKPSKENLGLLAGSADFHAAFLNTGEEE